MTAGLNAPLEVARWRVVGNVIMAIPHFIILYILQIVAMIAAFFAALITGRWPEGVRKFVLGVGFWSVRVNAWYFLLADPYPPFAID